MSFHDVRLDESYERGARGGPGFKTTITTLASGHEQRNGDWQRARGRWNVGYGVRKRSDFISIYEFFLARNGRLFGFRFKDWLDYEVVDQQIGVGDSSDTQFQLIKTYTSGSQTYTRPVYKPVASTLSIELDGSPTTAFTLDDATGVVTFDSAPGMGVVITATFEFDVPVRFDEDDLEIALQYVEAGSVPSIPIVELRQIDVVLNP